ncbi:MAG TPA: hypothetical protein VLW06_04420 [Terriglobales bacterium]|nr:hypothetical protein [Terriglobales bacterium]
MKRLVFGGFAVILCTAAMCAMAQAQSDSQPLGDYARSVRKAKAEDTKPAAKVYDNDNLPAAPSISVVGDSSAPATQADSANPKSATPQNSDDPTKIKPGQSQEERQKAYDTWKQRIDQQREKIDQLADDLESYKKTATMPTAQVWPYNEQYQQGLTEKQKALDDAKAALSDMQEDARKAGVPSSVAQ